MLSRLQEKNELASLNDRLAVYIERVRQLETENGRLSRVVTTHEESVTKEKSKIKGMFEDELASARKLLDDISKEKARSQMENVGLRKEIDELRDKLKLKEADLDSTNHKLLSAEAQISQQQARINEAVSQRRYWEDEFNKLKKELDGMAKTLATTKKNLDEETVARVDLENRLQSMKEDVAFKAQLHEQEISETFAHSRVVVEEVDSKLQDEYDSRLREALQQIREDNEEQIKMMRIETEAVFEKKYAELREAASRNEGSSEKQLSEMRSLRKRVDEQSSEISRLNNLIHSYENKLRDLETQLKLERDEHLAEADSLNAQIRSLKKTIEEQMEEYRDLMDVKIKLDTEIAAYRKLLEAEEIRLKSGSGYSVRIGTPGGESSRKRKRVDLDGDSPYGSSSVSTSGRVEYQCSSTTKDAIKFEEICPDGKFVKLINTSDDKEMAVGGWQVKVLSGDNETIYKFHRTLHVKPGQSVTIWSSDADQTHSPPTDLVMKTQAWQVGDANSAILLDQKGEEIATFDMKKSSVIRTSSSLTRYDAESSINQSRGSGKGWLSFLSMMG